MRVLLINPPFAEVPSVDRRQRCTIDTPEGWSHPPLAQAYIASCVQKWNNCETKITDAIALRLSEERFLDEVKVYHPDFVISIAGAFTYAADFNILARIKEMTDATTVVFGEIVSALASQFVNEYGGIDFFIRGDPEWPASKIIEYKKGLCGADDIPGITYKDGDKIYEHPIPSYPHIDTLPFPDRDKIDNLSYRCVPFIDGHYTDIMTSRGCPYRCTFCTSQRFWGRINRERSAENVLTETDLILSKYGIKNLFITDETFAINKDRIGKILPQFKKWGIRFAIQTRVGTLNRGEIREMAECGCVFMHYGIESGAQKILDYYKKDITVEMIEETIRWTKEAGIPIYGSFIIGNPIETPQEIEATIAFAKKLDLDFYHFGPLVPFPLSDTYNDLDAAGKLKTKDFTQYRKPNIVYKMENLTEDEVRYYLRRVYRETILNPRYILRRLRWLLNAKRGFREVLKEILAAGKWIITTNFRKNL